MLLEEDIYQMNKQIRRQEESNLGKYLLTPEAKNHKMKSRLREFDTASTGYLPDEEIVRTCLFDNDDGEQQQLSQAAEMDFTGRLKSRERSSTPERLQINKSKLSSSEAN